MSPSFLQGTGSHSHLNDHYLQVISSHLHSTCKADSSLRPRLWSMSPQDSFHNRFRHTCQGFAQTFPRRSPSRLHGIGLQPWMSTFHFHITGIPTPWSCRGKKNIFQERSVCRSLQNQRQWLERMFPWDNQCTFLNWWLQSIRSRCLEGSFDSRSSSLPRRHMMSICLQRN